jgi:hypothetical protein
MKMFQKYNFYKNICKLFDMTHYEQLLIDIFYRKAHDENEINDFVINYKNNYRFFVYSIHSLIK